jgi:hypothetical protein
MQLVQIIILQKTNNYNKKSVRFMAGKSRKDLVIKPYSQKAQTTKSSTKHLDRSHIEENK